MRRLSGEAFPLIERNADKHLVSVPGIFYGGGCAYMACSGLLMGPMKDILLITHGPTGCRYYSGINGARDRGTGHTVPYRARTFSTDLDETDIVFGGEEKLARAIDEAVGRYHPACIVICATCPVGLIGDDVERVAAEAAERHGIEVLPISCEGFKDEPGWLTGARDIMDSWVGRGDDVGDEGCPAEARCSAGAGRPGAFPIHLMSESYVGGGKQAIGALLERIGYDVVCSLMGETSFEELKHASEARLIVLDSNKEIDEIPAELARRYGAGFFHVQFTGLGNIDESLRRMAAFFGDAELMARTEEVIVQEHERIRPALEGERARFAGLKAAVFEDIFRSDAFANLSDELGIGVIMVAQDYTAQHLVDEGFAVELPEALWSGAAKASSDANPSEVLPDANPSEAFPDAERPGASQDAGLLGDLPWMEVAPSAKRGDRVRLALNRNQIADLLSDLKPELAFAGIEEQFGYHGAKIRSELFTSDDRGVGYFGYDGILRYAQDLDMASRMSHWVTELPRWAAAGAVPMDETCGGGAGA